ncbi:MAG TPA: outer membrane beta-barrel protein [Pricia sp.]|nr:outer membrane beta-barrel protein [Pricia sp.]
MKKSIISFAITVIALCMVHTVSAQEFNKGTNVINAGFGIGGSFSPSGFGSATAGLGLSASYERGIWEVGGPGVISLGGYLGTTAYDGDFGIGNDDFSWRYYIVGARAAYHFNGLNVENLDVYGGAMLSLNIASYDGNNDVDIDTFPSGSVYVGGRWYFNENFGVFAEAGYGVAFLTLGAAFRF